MLVASARGDHGGHGRLPGCSHDRPYYMGRRVVEERVWKSREALRGSGGCKGCQVRIGIGCGGRVCYLSVCTLLDLLTIIYNLLRKWFADRPIWLRRIPVYNTTDVSEFRGGGAG